MVSGFRSDQGRRETSLVWRIRKMLRFQAERRAVSISSMTFAISYFIGQEITAVELDPRFLSQHFHDNAGLTAADCSGFT